MHRPQWRHGRPTRARVGQCGHRWGAECLERRRLFAAPPAPLGDEFRINGATEADQSAVSVAAGDAYFVTAWHSSGQDGSGRGVYARRFGPPGEPAGEEFAVNVQTALDQARPAVAASARNFVVAWQSEGQDGDRSGVFARRYDAAGNALDGEFQVNGLTEGRQMAPAVAVAPDGRFVVAWTGDSGDSGRLQDVFARAFAADGTPAGPEFVVNSDNYGNQFGPAVGIADDGRFVVCWEDAAPTLDGVHVYARRFAASGEAAGGAFPVTVDAAADVLDPSVAVGPDGDFVVAWHVAPGGGGGADYDVYARRYAAGGDPRGAPFPLAALAGGDQRSPALAVDADGSFLAAWHGAGRGAGADAGSVDDVYVRRFDASGAAAADEAPVNAHAAGEQSAASVAVGSGGRSLVAWQSAGQDGSGLGVYGRFFNDEGAPPTVTGVFVGSTGWTAAFRQRLAAAAAGSERFGFVVGGGAERPDELPWAGLDQVSVRFSRDVGGEAPRLRVEGLRVANYPVSAVEYDAEHFAYTFTLGRGLAGDRVAVSVGDLAFGFDVLPGDVTRDGAVNAADAGAVRAAVVSGGAPPGAGASVDRYSIFYDVNGNNRVDVRDYAAVRMRQLTALPPPPDVPGVASAERAARGTSIRRQIFSATPVLG